MLCYPYLRKADTASLSTRINAKMGYSDTVSLSNRINAKLNISDTSNMLNPYLRKSDTAGMLSGYVRQSALDDTSAWVRDSINALRADIGSGGGGVDTTSLSNRINTKVTKGGDSGALSLGKYNE